MPNKMLIDASHPEETRVVVTHGNRIEEFDFESQDKKQLRGNIYLARVTRVEPSLQAAFVEYGGNRHGFLAFSEIHPDYYQIPLADRQALLLADAEAAEAEEDEDDEERSNRRRNRGRKNKGRGRDDERKPSHADAKDSAGKSDGDVEDKEGGGNGPALGDIENFEPAAFLSNSFALPVSEGGDDIASQAPASDETPVEQRGPEKSIQQQLTSGESAPASEQTFAGEPEDAAAPASEGDDERNDQQPNNGSGSAMPSAIQGESVSESLAEASENEQDSDTAEPHLRGERTQDNDESDESDDDNSDDEVESVGAEDAIEEARPRRRANRRQYKIQEVIKRRQILLVQVVKEERGNKGAALTTYLSLAGRYSVLMPNTARGGGISRKITNVQDRKRLKDVVKDLEVPQGMGVILRTAGESRTKAEIKRDYEYLMRMWENVRTLTLQSTAPALVYEEGSLIKRSVRDLYNKDIDEIQVAGDEGYREAKDFMRMLMPSHAKVVQPYRDTVPIFARNGIEAQLDRMLQPQVNLKSGGYIIINQTEALVAIDVNSGRSTKEHSIEDTALQTNLEAADEVARQLRLRDLAGLIVVDFIDMEENRNNRAVEKRMKDALKNDRARIQVGRISHFGLLEMSRQRIRASVLESTTQTCPHCGGTGHIRSESSVALHVIRAIEEYCLKDNRSHISVRTPVSTALYVLNQKRSTLVELERRFGLTISLEADETLGSQHYAIVKGAPVENPIAVAPPTFGTVEDEGGDEPLQPFDDDAESALVDVDQESADAGEAEPQDNSERDNARKRRRRRRRRGGRDRDEDHAVVPAVAGDHGLASNADEAAAADESTEADVEAADPAQDADSEQKKRRRGKRGGRRNRREGGENGDDVVAASASDGESAETPANLQQSDFTGITPESIAAIDAEGETAQAESPVEPQPQGALGTSENAENASADLPSSDGDGEAAAGAVEDGQDAPVANEAPSAPAKRPRARRSSKKAVAAPEVQTASEQAPEAVAADAIGDSSAPAQHSGTAAYAEAPEEVSSGDAVDAEESGRTSRRRTSNPDAPVEPVVTSNVPDDATSDEAPAPRKGGWWQRKSFF